MFEIAIKLDENVYTRLFDNGLEPSEADINEIQMAIREGNVLEPHGRLVDIDKFEKFWEQECPTDCGCCTPKRRTDGRGKWYDVCMLFDKAPTILEATE